MPGVCHNSDSSTQVVLLADRLSPKADWVGFRGVNLLWAGCGPGVACSSIGWRESRLALHTGTIWVTLHFVVAMVLCIVIGESALQSGHCGHRWLVGVTVAGADHA